MAVHSGNVHAAVFDLQVARKGKAYTRVVHACVMGQG